MTVERPRRSIHGYILGTVRAVEPEAVPFGDAGLEDRTRSVVPIETDVVVATDEDVAVHVTDPSQNVRRPPERRVRATTPGQVTLLALLVRAIGVTARLVRCRSTDDSRCALAESTRPIRWTVHGRSPSSASTPTSHEAPGNVERVRLDADRMADANDEDRCGYTFDPERRSSVAGASVTDALDDENGLWRCPHDSHEDSDRCPIHLPPSAGTLEGTYVKAKYGANEVGDTKAAAEFFRKEMTHRRHQHVSGTLEGALADRAGALWRWTANTLLDATAGYGERPSRVVVVALLTVVGFSLVFSGSTSTQPYGNAFGYLILSLESFITLVLGGAASIEDSRVRLLAEV